MVQKFFKKLKNFNEIYIDYILCIAFLNLIILKINQIFFQILPIYLYPIIFLVSVLFIKQWLLITSKIKNTNLFNRVLYFFLIIKNGIYGFFFEYFNYIEQEKYKKLIIFLTGFVLSSWCLNILFFFFNHSYNVSIIFFIILLIINIFNLIEKKLIFTVENLKENKEEIDYNFVKTVLKINNQTFNKNKPLFYIQKRYIHFNEIKNLIKRHGVTVITSATAGSLFTGYLQYSNVQVQREQLNIQIEQFEFQKEQFEFQREIEKEKLNFNAIKMREERLSNYDEKIDFLNKKIHKLQVDMNSRYFWDKIDFSESLQNLKEERESLKRRRSSFELEEIKIDSNENYIINKKIENKSLDFLDN